MSDVRVVLPLRLVSEANVRGREHWAVRNARVSGQIDATALALRAPISMATKGGGAFPCAVSLTRIGPRMMDDDNAVSSCKNVRDAVAKLLGVDDRDPRVTWSYGQRKAGKGEPKYGVEIVIRRA